MRAVFVSIFGALSFICSLAQQNVYSGFVFQNKVREYILHTPTGFNISQSLPLYIGLHGSTSSDTAFMNYTQLNNVSDTAKFLVVYPNGIGKSWADGRGTTNADIQGIDDISFIARLIDTIVVKYNANPNKVYVAGTSNGGLMVQRLLCELGSKIAAGASCAASITDSVRLKCSNACPKPVMFIHGTADNFVTFNGGAINGANGGGGLDGYSLHADTAYNFWVNKNSCNGVSTVSNLPNIVILDNSTVVKKEISSCTFPTAVVQYKVVNGGHTWPDAAFNIPALGVLNKDINASEVTWNFFKTKSLQNCIPVQVTDLVAKKNSIIIYPNPVKNILQFNQIIQGEIIIKNVLGEIVKFIEDSSGIKSIDVTDLANGIYYIYFKDLKTLERSKFIKQ
jgi:polyhydroxybutyrate depolymerase